MISSTSFLNKELSMISSTSFLNKEIPPLQRWGRGDLGSWLFPKATLFLVGAIFFLSGCAGTSEGIKRGSYPVNRQFSIAVFPIENLTGTRAPLREIRESLINLLRARGLDVLEDETLEKVMARNRIRYTGGIDDATAQAFGRETSAKGVFIASLEVYSEANPPKMALISRLISTGDSPTILWADGVGLAGDDSPGILGVGLIEDPKILLQKALEFVSDSLTGSLLMKKGEPGREVKKKFRPKIAYRSPEIVQGKKYKVAVLPFFNKSERKYGGEIIQLQFIKNLQELGSLEVIEPGLVRQQFLKMRIIMDQGVSLADAEAIFATLDADLVVSGDLITYQDYQGALGTPKVDFSVLFVDGKGRKVVWSSTSYNTGDDGVFFFDTGRVNIAHAMASQMIRWIGEMMLGESQKIQGGKGSSGPPKQVQKEKMK
jgi:TolB-like protein